MAQKVKHLPAMWETLGGSSLGGEDPLEKDLAPPSGTLAWKILPYIRISTKFFHVVKETRSFMESVIT